MTLDEIELLERGCILKSRNEFYAYRQYMSGFKMKTGWFVREISSAIQQFYSDYRLGLRPVLVIQAPPQHGKSEAVTDGVSWMVGKDPSLRFIYASFSDRLGVRANLKLQRTITREKYQKVFPGTRINNRKTATSVGYQRNKEMVEFCEAGGSFRNTTVRGSITGETLDIGIIDDPIKGREEANSPTIRDKTWNWFTDDFQTRFDEMGGLLIILTRWHVDDPVGRLVKINPKVKVLSYKALAENDEKFRKEGEALFPEHKSKEFLMGRKSIMPSGNWQSLYQQNPVIPGGGIFKNTWWNFYKALPIIKYRIIYGDTAQKTKEQNDYSVFQCWGMGSDGRIYLLDMIRGKWEAPELLTRAKAFWEKHKAITRGFGTLRKMKIEDKSSGTGLIQQLRPGIPVVGIPRSIDKISRALDVVPQIEVGKVVLPESAPWLSDLLTEAEQFPNAAHDDTIDPMIDAINDMLIESGSIDYGKLL